MIFSLTDAALTWFCEDCATKLEVPPSLDQSIPLSFETRDFINLENNAARNPDNCKERVKKGNKQQKKKIKKKQDKGKVNSDLVAIAKVVSSDIHIPPDLELPQSSISCEEESNLKNECGPSSKDVANSDVGFKSVPVCQGATNNDSGCVDRDDYVDAQPVIDPVWRYESCFPISFEIGDFL